VARNRKRAKDRRPRRPPQAGSARSGVSGNRSSVPGVLPASPTVTDEPAVEPEENGAPAPLEHATPDVELAEEQLAVGRPGEPEPDDEADEDEFELEVEESIESGRRRRGHDDGEAGGSSGGAVKTAVAPHGQLAEHKPGIFARLIAFLQGSWRELQRVQWPDRRQVVQATSVVIGFVIVASIFLGVADWAAGKIVTFILK
jgi:preprotein translocase subunit SecE